MRASDMVRAALAGAGKTQKELAEHMGWTPQNLSGRLKNNSLTSVSYTHLDVYKRQRMNSLKNQVH